MSQSDFGTIVPDTTSGVDLADMLMRFRDAVESNHSGSARPTYVRAGMDWLDTSVNPWKYYLYDGADDILIGTFDTAANTFSPTVASNNISDATTVGKAVLTSATTSSAQTAIGGSVVGRTVFTASTGADARAVIAAAASGTNTDIKRLDGCGPEAFSVCVGSSSLAARTTGVGNTCIGVSAGSSITTGSYNAVVGHGAGLGAALVDSNISIGYASLNGVTSSTNNIAIGQYAGASVGNAPGGGNVFLGGYAGDGAYNNSTCVFIGARAGQATRGATNSVALGYNSGSSEPNYTNWSCIGANAQVSGSSQVQLGNSTTTTYVYGTVQNRSDARDKAEVKDTSLGLAFINSLRPVDYKWDMREDYKQDPSDKLEDVVKDGSKVRGRFHHGFIAQEVKGVTDSLGIDFGGYQDHKIAGGDDVLSLGYDEFIAPLVRAVQELSAKVDMLQEELKEVKGTK